MSNPVKVNLESGKKYHFCTCGKSEDGILCNGSHVGTDFQPKEFSEGEDKDYYLCASKKSSNIPFCDGSHSK